MRQKAFLGKLVKKIKAQRAEQQNYGGVQELPMYGIGYDERMQYVEGGQTMYSKDKKKGMMYGGMSRKNKMGGGRSMYNKGGYASVQEMEKTCGSKTVTQKVK